MKKAQIDVPWLVRIKPGALARLGLYLARPCLTPIVLLHSEGLLQSILEAALQSLRAHGITPALLHEVKEAGVEESVHLLGAAPSSCRALVGVGGGPKIQILENEQRLASYGDVTTNSTGISFVDRCG